MKDTLDAMAGSKLKMFDLFKLSKLCIFPFGGNLASLFSHSIFIVIFSLCYTWATDAFLERTS